MVCHVERMDKYRMARRVLMVEVSGRRVRSKPRSGWMDFVKVALAKEECHRRLRDNERSERVESPGANKTE